MTATLTPTAYTLRCGPHHASYGDPYTIAAHAQRVGKDGKMRTVTIPSLSIWTPSTTDRLTACSGRIR